MADPRFYTVAGPFSVAELAEIARAELGGAADATCMIRDVAPLQTAGPGEISFFDNRAYQSAFQASNAAACLVGTELSASPPAAMTLLVTDNPYRAYADVARAFYPDIDAAAAATEGTHIDPTASLAEAVVVEPGAVIGARAEIGPRTRIGANAVIGPGVCFGADCAVGAGASVRFCIAGNGVRIAAGARIGEDGFGYAPGEDGHVKIPQLGRVLLGDGVEIGANTTIDRGAGPDTVIGDGCIIDNLVQVAHNVRMGRNCIIVAQVGLSGSTTLGDNVVIGGQAGTAGHITVGDGVRIGAQAGVISDLESGVTVIGSPAQPQGEVWRQIAWVKRMAARKKKE